MKTARGVATELRNLLSLLVESQVALLVRPVVCERLGYKTRVTWSRAVGFTGTMASAPFATVEEYCYYIESQLYSAVLFDGALLQITFDFQGDDLVGHRLCYYPCPFDIDRELLSTEPFGEVVDLYRGSLDGRINLRSPCRFDYNSGNSGGADPFVHVHLIRPHFRWPVTAPLSIGHFVGFIFRQFYPEVWALQPFLSEWPKERAGCRMTTLEEESYLHVACGR